MNEKILSLKFNGVKNHWIFYVFLINERKNVKFGGNFKNQGKIVKTREKNENCAKMYACVTNLEIMLYKQTVHIYADNAAYLYT